MLRLLGLLAFILSILSLAYGGCIVEIAGNGFILFANDDFHPAMDLMNQFFMFYLFTFFFVLGQRAGTHETQLWERSLDSAIENKCTPA